jgi:hypothetical protein
LEEKNEEEEKGRKKKRSEMTPFSPLVGFATA